ncbi:MAG: LysR family transcriptional regulator [Rhodospirillales bacterium]|nr:LysR family transcriptional regulator [Rhodospirillales bacterium]
MIKLELLRVFVTVAELGSIKDAAAQLCRTASAVSMALKRLEEEAGGALFEADRKHSLTALGAFVLETGRVQVASYDRAIGRIHAFAQNRLGRLTLAAVPSVAATLVPSLLLRFLEDRSGVEIELFDTDSQSMKLSVQAGRTDLGIAGRPPPDRLICFEPLFRDRFKILCSTSCRLALLDRPVRWSDLEGETVIRNGAAESIQVPEYRALSDRATITVRNVTSLFALAKAGFGVTLLPALTATGLPAGLAALDLADPAVARTVGLLRRRGGSLSPVAAAFRTFLLDEIRAHAADFALQPIR